MDEAQLLEDYHRLYWTRLMTITGYEMHQDRKWPLGPDVVQECQAVEAMPAVNQDEWIPVFEPARFNEVHGPLEIDHSRLTQHQLKQWAQRCAEIRRTIKEKARLQTGNEEK